MLAAELTIFIVLTELSEELQQYALYNKIIQVFQFFGEKDLCELYIGNIAQLIGNEYCVCLRVTALHHP